MTSIITLIIVFASLMSLVDVKPPHYQEYNLIGEIPEVLVTAPRYSANQDANQTGMMSLVEVTANRYEPNQNSSGDIPEVIVTAPRHYRNQDIKSHYELMPEVVITAPRYNFTEDLKSMGMMSEVVVTAPRYQAKNNGEIGMMPTVEVTAERYPQTNTDIIQQRPGFGIDCLQSSVKIFYVYAMFAVLVVFIYAWTKTFLPRIILRPIFVTNIRAQLKRRHQSATRK